MKLSCKIFYQIATVIIVLIILSTVLFWVRFAVSFAIAEYLPHKIEISPSGLTADLEGKNDANIPSKIELNAQSNPADFLGIAELDGKSLKKYLSNPYIAKYFDKTQNLHKVIYYDKSLRLFVYCHLTQISTLDGMRYKKEIISYLGRNGVCEKDDSKNKFCDLVFCGFGDDSFGAMLGLVCFDRQDRRFYAVKMIDDNYKITDVNVKQGAIIEDSLGDIAQIGTISKNESAVSGLWFSPPLKTVKITDENKDAMKEYSYTQPYALPHYKEENGQRQKYANAQTTDEKIWLSDILSNGILVLTSKGDIYILNKKLEISKKVACLKDAHGYGTPSPKNLFAYNFNVFNRNDEIKGGVLAGISSIFNFPFVIVFDENGFFKTQETIGKDKITYKFEAIPWSFWAKYILESLQPLVFGITSYMTADTVDLENQFQAMFILPDSYVAFFGRETGGAGRAIRFLFAVFILLLPSLLLGLGLGWKVWSQADAAGLGRMEKRIWVLAVVLLGIGGYIGWKLVKPKDGLITCKNCGKLRRCQAELCHNCGHSWDFADIQSPQWKVFAE